MRSFDQFVESSSKIIRDELNPKFWDGKELKEDVRKSDENRKYYANWTDIPMTAWRMFIWWVVMLLIFIMISPILTSISSLIKIRSLSVENSWMII